jgi:hypothetical protein
MSWLIVLTNVLFSCGIVVALLCMYAHLKLSWVLPQRRLREDAAGVGLGLAVISLLWAAMGSANASTLTMVTTPVRNIVATVQDIGYIMVPVLFVGMLWHYHRGGFGIGTVIEIVGIVLIVAIIVYASDIITWIRPATAAASSDVQASVEGALTLWGLIGPRLVGLASATMGIRHVRRPRRV